MDLWICLDGLKNLWMWDLCDAYDIYVIDVLFLWWLWDLSEISLKDVKYMWYIVFVVVKYKNKKNRSFLVTLLSVREMALGKVTICPSKFPSFDKGHSTKIFQKKKSLPSAIPRCTRQNFQKNSLCPVPPWLTCQRILPSAHPGDTWQIIFFKKNCLCRVPFEKTLGKATVSYKITMTTTFLCRGLLETLDKIFTKCSTKDTRQRTLYRWKIAESSLPSVTLGKDFAECNSAFADCRSHPAKHLFRVVVPAFDVDLGILHNGW